MPTRIFISHRHLDEPIASVFRQHFQDWDVPAAEIFQSSDYRSGVRMGEPLLPQIVEKLQQAVLVLWIYTTSEGQAHCILECSIAANPAAGHVKTRVVVFQVAAEEERLFPGQVFFRNVESDIKKFVYQFHKQPGFYDQDKPYRPDAADDLIDRRAAALYKALRNLQWPGAYEDRWRWDRLTLSVGKEDVLKIRTSVELQERREHFKNSATVSGSFGSALVHFGYTADATNITLAELVLKWQKKVAKEPYAHEGWLEYLCDEMSRAIENEPAEPRWELIKSSQYSSDWFYPIMNHARLMPTGGFEFDVYLYRVPGDLPYKVNKATA